MPGVPAVLQASPLVAEPVGVDRLTFRGEQDELVWLSWTEARTARTFANSTSSRYLLLSTPFRRRWMGTCGTVRCQVLRGGEGRPRVAPGSPPPASRVGGGAPTSLVLVTLGGGVVVRRGS